MSRTTHLGWLVVLLLAVALPANAQQAIVDVVKLVRPAVVTITTYDAADMPEAQASGFFVDRSHVITNHHVVDGAVRVEVKTTDGKVYNVTRIVAEDPKPDLAMLEIERPVSGITPLKVISTVPQPGERVVVVGSPLGLESSVSDGVVSEVREVPDLGRVMQISAPVSSGSSGSPVVNLSGEVVGVAEAIRAGGQNLNFAVPGSQILALKPSSNRNLEASPAGGGAGPAGMDSYRKGQVLFKAKSYQAALPYFLDTARANPKNYLAWFAAGHCYVQTGKYGQAVDAFQKAIVAKPDFPEAYSSLGAALALQNNYDGAVVAFKQAIKLDPEQSVAHFGLGMIYAATSDSDGALREYKILMDLDPTLAQRLFETMYS